jgi:hypothetical protein
MKTYDRSNHSFFDLLISYLTSIASFGMATEAHNFGLRIAFKPNELIELEGMPHVSNIALSFSPYTILQPIAKNQWPEKIEFEEKPSNLTPDHFSKFPIKLTSTQLIHCLILQSMFLQYYESVLSDIELLYTTDVNKWPSVLNFARVIRNACAHRGQIYFLNLNAHSVNWKTLEYTPLDNGRNILFQDITSVEVILLMEDINKVLQSK